MVRKDVPADAFADDGWRPGWDADEYEYRMRAEYLTTEGVREYSRFVTLQRGTIDELTLEDVFAYLLALLDREAIRNGAFGQPFSVAMVLVDDRTEEGRVYRVRMGV